MSAAGYRPRKDAQPSVLISGTFDVGNFGDLLFPIVAQHRLGSLGYRVVPVSPTGRATLFCDAMPPVALPDVMATVPECRALLIGGGEIIHAWPSRFISEYEPESLARSAYLSLWHGASVLASVIDVPIVWNAPGLPSLLPERVRSAALRPVLEAAGYVALRDDASVRALRPAPGETISVVPDTAAEIAKVWPRASLQGVFLDLLERKAISSSEHLVAIHIRPGGWGRITPAEMAAQIDAVAAAHGVMPVLISIGPSLGDRASLHELSSCLSCRHALLDDVRSLREIAAVIAHAKAYVGNSLHGFITSASYGVPGIVVAVPGFRKFAGFAVQIGREGDVAREWPSALARLSAQLGDSQAVATLPVHDRLDRHWQNVAAAIADPERRREQRAALVRHELGLGLPREGMEWLWRAMTAAAREVRREEPQGGRSGAS